MVVKSLLDRILALPVTDRMELYERLLESLQADPSAFPLTADQREAIDRRAAEMKKDPTLGSSWAEVKPAYGRSNEHSAGDTVFE